MIVACVKRAVDPSTVVVSARSGEIVQPGAWGLNEWDRPVLEAAIRLSERYGDAWMALTVGDAECVDVLREAAARGASALVRVWNDALAHADGGVRARVLHATIASLDDVRCVVAGEGSPAGVHEQVAAQLAEHVRWPLRRVSSDGELQCDAPAVYVPSHDAFALRSAKAAAVMKAFRAPIDVREPATSALDPAVRVLRTEAPAA